MSSINSLSIETLGFQLGYDSWCSSIVFGTWQGEGYNSVGVYILGCCKYDNMIRIRPTVAIRGRMERFIIVDVLYGYQGRCFLVGQGMIDDQRNNPCLVRKYLPRKVLAHWGFKH